MSRSGKRLVLALCLASAFVVPALMTPVASADGGDATASQEQDTCDRRPNLPQCRRQEKQGEACKTDPTSARCRAACTREKNDVTQAEARLKAAKAFRRFARRKRARFNTRKSRRRLALANARVTAAESVLAAQKAEVTALGCP